MSNIRDRIEAWFADLATKIYDHRLKTLALSAIFVALFISQFPKIQVDASTEGFLFDDDPAMVTYNDFRERFGMDGMVIIALKPGKVFEPVFLKKLRALHQDLRANLPHLEEITSLVNARSTRGEKDELIVEDFLENWPVDAQEMAALEKRAKANVMYENMLLSEDGAFTTIVIQSRSYSPEGGGSGGSAAGDVSGGGSSPNGFSDKALSDNNFSDRDFSDNNFSDNDFSDNDFTDNDFTNNDFSDNNFSDGDFSDNDFSDGPKKNPANPTVSNKSGPAPPITPAKKKFLTDAENSEIVQAVETITKRHDFGETKIYIAGPPVVTDFLKRAMLEDMKTFMGIVILSIALFLFVMFRRVSGVVMPLFVVLLSLLSTVGLMAACGVAIKLPTQILPSFILAVGVGDAVHILVIFFHHFNRHGKKRDAVEYAVGHSGLAILMTSLTTAGGLLSFSTADVAPIADLGQFAAAGVILAFVYTIVILPALLSLIPLKPAIRALKKTSKAPFSDRFLTGVASVSIRWPHRVLAVSLAVIVLSVWGASKLEIWHNPMKWLPEDSSARLANEIIDRELKGSTNLEVIIDTKKENGIYDPDFLNRLERAANVFDTFTSEKVSAGKAWSITTVLKETNQALHGNDPAFYTVAQDEKLVAQELLLFENSGSDDLTDFTDTRFSMARFTIKVPFIDALAYSDFIKTVQAHFTTAFPDAEVAITGLVPLLARVITAAIWSMVKSYGYAIGVITLLMILLIGRVRIGLISMIPNLTPIVAILGIMGWAGIRMDLFSMLVGSIAIGLAVDDTIHFMHNFRRYFEQSGDAEYAVTETLLTTGRAMLVTTCVLSIGFFAFMFAGMKNLFNFGFLTGTTLIMALASDYFLAPALMIVLNKKK